MENLNSILIQRPSKYLTIVAGDFVKLRQSGWLTSITGVCALDIIAILVRPKQRLER